MAFDVQGALKEGYTASEINEYLAKEKNFDLAGARKEGYTDDDILSFLNPTKVLSQKPEDVGMLTRAKQALTEGFESLGGAKRGIELGSAVDNKDMTAAAAKMQDIKTKGQVAPAVQTLTAADIQRIAEEKGLIPAGMQVPSFVVEQILKSGPEMAIPLLTGFAASAGTAAVTGPAAPLAAPIVGALVGIGTYGVQQYGHFMERQALEKTAPQDLNPAEAKKWAAITAPLGYVVDRFTLGMGKVGTKTAIKEITKEIAERGAGKFVAKGVGEGALSDLVESRRGRSMSIRRRSAALRHPAPCGESTLRSINSGRQIPEYEMRDQIRRTAAGTGQLPL